VAVTAVVEALAKMAVVMVEMAAAMMRSKSHRLPASVIRRRRPLEKAAGVAGWERQ